MTFKIYMFWGLITSLIVMMYFTKRVIKTLPEKYNTFRFVVTLFCLTVMIMFTWPVWAIIYLYAFSIYLRSMTQKSP